MTAHDPGPDSISARDFFRQLREGQCLAGRYEIRALLGQGAMGVVFEALDLELGTAVALKLLRPEISDDPSTVERFRRELATARLVTHPNACRVYDLGRHELDDDEALSFLTMELLRGPDLSDVIEDRAPMTAADTLPLVLQIAAGLSAAHEAGVVHRDFKAGNIILVRGSEGSERAVITDFGLSRQLFGGKQQKRLTLTGQVMGTPAYVAPEQLAGAPTTPATDLYALGVLLYHMRTGTLPFTGSSPIATAVERMKTDPTLPSSRHPGVEPHWDRVILKCLAREPEQRFQSADDVVAALRNTGRTFPTDSSVSKAITREISTHDRRPERWWLTAVAAGALLLILGLVFTRSLRFGTGDPATATATVAARPVIGVLDFTNRQQSEAADWVTTIVPELLAVELATDDSFRVLPRSVVSRRLLELGSVVESDAIGELATSLRAEYLVTGSVDWAGPPEAIRLRLEMIRADRTLLILLEPETVPEELLEEIRRSAARLREVLGSPEPTPGPLEAAFPSSVEIARLYALGLAHLRRFDAGAASAVLAEAARIAPKDPLVHAALASAWQGLGFDQRARQEAEVAWNHRNRLPRAEQLLVEGRYRELNGEIDRAVEAYGALHRFYPDDPEYGLLLAAAQTRAGLGARALATVAGMRAYEGVAEDPRLDLAEAEAATAAGDYFAAHDAAGRALEQSRESRESLLEARALLAHASSGRRLGYLESSAHNAELAQAIYAQVGNRSGEAHSLLQLGMTARRAGRYGDARTSLHEAITIYETIGHRAGVGQATADLADVDRAEGDFDTARERYSAARATLDEIGNLPGLYSALRSLAIVDSIQGFPEAARDTFQASLDTAREWGDRSSEAAALNNLAIVESDLGELDRAERLYDRALEIFRAIGHREGAASALNNIAILRWDRGHLESADRSYREAIDLADANDDPSAAALFRANLAEILIERDRLPEAKAMLDDAIEAQELLGEPLAAAKTHAYLAIVELERQDVTTATGHAHTAAERLVGQGIPDDEAFVLAVLARALAAAGELQQGLEAIERAAAAGASRGNPAMTIWVEQQRALLLSAAGRHAEALDTAQRALGEARRSGLERLVLGARLVLGLVELAGGHDQSGRKRLRSLVDDARISGFDLVSRKAAEAAA